MSSSESKSGSLSVDIVCVCVCVCVCECECECESLFCSLHAETLCGEWLGLDYRVLALMALIDTI
jgi:hypothetical protein